MKSYDEQGIHKQFLLTIYKNENGFQIGSTPIEELLKAELKDFVNCLQSDTISIECFRKHKAHYKILGYYDHCIHYFGVLQGFKSLLNFESIRYIIEDFTHTFIKRITERVEAYRFAEAYKTAENLKSDGAILAYSHSKVGWTTMEHELNSDIKIIFNTNFGFGDSSYFMLLIKYKGITIAPYSAWIHYNFRNAYSILRYTRSYALKPENWGSAFEDCVKASNLALVDEDLFIETYIIKEAETMILFLKKVLENDVFCLNEISRHVKSELYQEELIMAYKGEKITGALDFISHLNQFEISLDLQRISEQIVLLNHTIKPLLDSELSKLRIECDELKKQLEPLEVRYDEVKDRYNQNLGHWNSIVRHLADTVGTGNYSKADIEKRMAEIIPSWKDDEAKYFQISKQYHPLKERHARAAHLNDRISSFVKKYVTYFN